MKKRIALILAIMMVLGMAGCGKSDAVKAVEQSIVELGDNISIDDEATVAAIRTAYDNLEEKEKNSVENYQALLHAEEEINRLIQEKNELEWQELFEDGMNFTEGILDDCRVVVDLYNKISNAASNAPSTLNLIGGKDVNTYYKLIRGVDGSDYVTSFYKASQNSFPLIAVVVYPERYSYSVAKYFSDYYTIMDTIKVDDKDIDKIVENCVYYNGIIDNLPVKNALVFERIKLLKDKGGADKQAVIDALYDYYLAVDSAVNYVLNPSGSLSSVVSGFSNMLTAVEQAKKTLDMVS